MISLHNNKKGFTIIELMIVIVVIGLLAAIGFVAYGNVTKSARDSDRQADASALAKKGEEFYAAKGIYPASITTAASAADTSIEGMTGIDDKTLNSPNNNGPQEGGNTVSTCVDAATAPQSVGTDYYCYSVTAAGDAMSVMYWNEANGGTETITGVNN